MLARVGINGFHLNINEVFMPSANLAKNNLQLIRHNTSLAGCGKTSRYRHYLYPATLFSVLVGRLLGLEVAVLRW